MLPAVTAAVHNYNIYLLRSYTLASNLKKTGDMDVGQVPPPIIVLFKTEIPFVFRHSSLLCFSRRATGRV